MVTLFWSHLDSGHFPRGGSGSGQVVKMDGEEKGPFLLPFLSFASILTIFSIYVLSSSLFFSVDGEGGTPSKYRLVLLLSCLCFVATIQGVYVAL